MTTQVYEVGQWRAAAGRTPAPYFVFEYVEGGSLDKRLAGTPLAAAQASALAETLARAVAYAHERGIIHRDLKPANILLSVVSSQSSVANTRGQLAIDDGSLTLPKIGDFGLGKRIDLPGGPTQSGVIVGTPSYMAPEQAAGATALLGPAVDVYALGAILYEMLTGRPPFRAATSIETVMQVLHETPVPPRRLQPRLARDLETICLKCLEKQPRQRYASALELAEDLRRFRAGEPIRARPASAIERLTKWVRRRPALAAMSGGVALTLAALLVVWARFTADLKTARDIAYDKQIEAEDNFQEAQHQKQLAIASLQRAQAAAREFVGLVRDDAELKAHGQEALRRRLLQRTTHLYEDLVAEFGSIPELQDEQAAAYHELAVQTVNLSGMAAAVGYFEKAIAISERLSKDHAEEQRYWTTHGLLLVNFGYCLEKLDRLAAAEAALRQALAIFERSTALQPRNGQQQFFLAACRDQLGVLLNKSQRLAEAETAFLAATQAIETALQIVDVKDYFNRQATILLHLSKIYEQTARPDGALSVCERARAIGERLVQRFPNYPDYVFQLPITDRHIGCLYSGRDRQSEAEAAFGRSEASLTSLVNVHPKVRKYRRELAELYHSLSDCHGRRRQRAPAATALQKAFEHTLVVVSEDPPEADDLSRLVKIALEFVAVAENHAAPELTKRLAQAIAAIEPALRHDDTKVAAGSSLAALHRAQGEVLDRLGRHAEAQAAWKRAESFAEGTVRK